MVGALEPGTHTLAFPLDSTAQVLVAPQAMLGQVLHSPFMPCPAQHDRQNEVGLLFDSRTHTPQALQNSETVQGSPGSPRGVQVPPTQV